MLPVTIPSIRVRCSRVDIWLWFIVLSVLGLRVGNAASSDLQLFNEATQKPADSTHGRQLFASICAACHGPDGAGSPDGLAPMIAGQQPRVLARQLIDYRAARRWDPRMEAVAREHGLADSQAIADVIAYVSTLPRVVPAGVGDGEHVERGATLYRRQCAACHGAGGEGDDVRVVPRLQGQHYAYLLRQMYDAVGGRRPNFSAEHVRLLRPLERDDLVGLADYLSRLGRP